MKACADCRHVLKADDRAICMHPETARWIPDYYTGKERLEHPPVDFERTLGGCGPGARLWEARDAGGDDRCLTG